MPAATLGQKEASGLGIDPCSAKTCYCSTSEWQSCRPLTLYCSISHAAPLEIRSSASHDELHWLPLCICERRLAFQIQVCQGGDRIPVLHTIKITSMSTSMSSCWGKTFEKLNARVPLLAPALAGQMVGRSLRVKVGFASAQRWKPRGARISARAPPASSFRLQPVVCRNTFASCRSYRRCSSRNLVPATLTAPSHQKESVAISRSTRASYHPETDPSTPWMPAKGTDRPHRQPPLSLDFALC